MDLRLAEVRDSCNPAGRAASNMAAAPKLAAIGVSRVSASSFFTSKPTKLLAEVDVCLPDVEMDEAFNCENGLINRVQE